MVRRVKLPKFAQNFKTLENETIKRSKKTGKGSLAEYLGLRYDDMIHEFNEYLFDYTSKISLDDIRKAKKKIEKKRKKDSRVASPYTIEKKEKPDISHTVLYIALGLLILTMSLLVINQINQDKTSNDDNVLASV